MAPEGVLWLPSSGSLGIITINPPIYSESDGVHEGEKNRKSLDYIVGGQDGCICFENTGYPFGDWDLGAALRGAFDALSKCARENKLSGHVRSLLANSAIYVHLRPYTTRTKKKRM